MTDHDPSAGMPEYLESGPEYLEPGGGSPLQPDGSPAEAPARRSRRGWWIGGGLVVLLGAGAGAWAALSFFHQGAQPAEALPSSTVAYLSIDLDPAGGQKLDAFRTLNKFPSFKNQVGVGSVDELRHKLGEEIIGGEHCPHLSYDHDVDPWLGDRAAVALVALPGQKPDGVVVVQVKDDAKARDGLSLLDSCATDRTGHTTGFLVQNGWAVIADSQAVAEKVVDAASHGTLADDPTYQKWTKAVGEAGVVNAYASPAAGRLAASQLSGLTHGLSPFMFTDPASVPGASAGYTASGAAFQGAAQDAADAADPFSQMLTGFRGGAATLRFTGDGLELAAVGDGTSGQLAQVGGNTAGSLAQRMPGDTAALAALTLPQGWVAHQLEQLATIFSPTGSPEAGKRELSRETGLDVPDDIDTLLGSGVALSVGSNFDLDAAENSADGSALPVALTVKGDPPAIDRVLGKLRTKLGSEAPYLGSDSQGDLEVIGPSSAYRQHVLTGGNLGDDGTFRSVVPDAGDAASVLYLNVDSLEASMAKASSAQEMGDVKPLRAIGMSSWRDGDNIRFSLKVSTG